MGSGLDCLMYAPSRISAPETVSVPSRSAMALFWMPATEPRYSSLNRLLLRPIMMNAPALV